MYIMEFVILVFFFQAEDGIRDIGVTGVQTCALPISEGPGRRARFEVEDTGPGVAPEMREAIFERFRQAAGGDGRAHGGTGLGGSEERRVGKECRFRWLPYY